MLTFKQYWFAKKQTKQTAQQKSKEVSLALGLNRPLTLCYPFCLIPVVLTERRKERQIEEEMCIRAKQH